VERIIKIHSFTKKLITMIKKVLFSLFLAVAVFGSWTCSDDNDDNGGCSTAWASELTDEANALISAAQTYGLNPTVANCNAYKQAAQKYLDALKPYGDCAALTGQERTDWQNAYNEAQTDVDNIDCSN
jgi:hypothetical protein